MGRPSKHRLQSQMTASLRQRDMKLLKLAEQLAEDRLMEDADENGWHGQTLSPPTTTYLSSSMSPDGLMTQDDGIVMRDEGEITSIQQRCRSFGSDCGPTNCRPQRVKSESDSHFAVVSPRRPSARNIDPTIHYVVTSPVSVKTESTDIIGLGSSLPLSSPPISAADRLLWQGATQQHVLSGGYCCEVDSSVAAAAAPTVPLIGGGDSFGHSPPYVSETAVGSRCDLMSVDEPSDYAAGIVVTPVSRATVESPDNGVAATSGRLSQASTDTTPAVDVSPGSKWHIASDRDSPYVSVMALASSCHLFSESCPSKSASNDDGSVTYDPASNLYWLEPDLPDENVIFTEKHCEMINQITAAYDRYVQTGTVINETLVSEMKVTFREMLHAAMWYIFWRLKNQLPATGLVKCTNQTKNPGKVMKRT